MKTETLILFGIGGVAVYLLMRGESHDPYSYTDVRGRSWSVNWSASDPAGWIATTGSLTGSSGISGVVGATKSAVQAAADAAR